ncbi:MULTISPECIES: hypothetical protein [Bacillus]|uniref:hypothetical protein n=1 Tax=Bacillus TaxID=1386 RepID=UPI00040EBF55|nr:MULTISPECIES: hypothetical protein [Bacillus]QHZ48394.1 hypothetical protein M654_020020 [Bacillus sp. NSP9.1]WFA05959.1 hypothetical protein P3X63_03830 [Bacillus sp. HSf4]
MIEEQHKRNEEDIEQEPASRMSRNARKTRKSKEPNPSASKAKRILQSVIAALFRYFSFVLDVLKSPVRAADEHDRTYFKYSVISMMLLAVFFSLGNFYQLLAGRGRVLGFGVNVPFFEVFFVVFLYCMIFMFWVVAAIWAAARFMMRVNISFYETAAKFGSLLVPFIIPAAFWMIFAIINFTTMTVILSILMFLGLTFGAFVLIQSVYEKSDKKRADLMYCVFAVLLIELVFVGATWKFMAGYLLSSLIPV